MVIIGHPHKCNVGTILRVRMIMHKGKTMAVLSPKTHSLVPIQQVYDFLTHFIMSGDRFTGFDFAVSPGDPWL